MQRRRGWRQPRFGSTISDSRLTPVGSPRWRSRFEGVPRSRWHSPYCCAGPVTDICG